MSKDLPPPPAGDDMAAALRRRLSDDAPPPPLGDTSRTPRTTRTRDTSARNRTSSNPRTPRTRDTGATTTRGEEPPPAVRRSWYMPKPSADALAAAVDDLHFETRRPKLDVIAALVSVALNHQDEARGQLADSPETE